MERSRPRLVVIHPWWDLWAHTAPSGLRDDRMALARRVSDDLADMAEPVAVVEAGSLEDAARTGEMLAQLAAVEGPIDALLVLQTMAAPVGHTLGILDRLPGVPVVVWAAHETGLVDGAFDHASITTQGATVGAPMLANMLVRTARPFDLVLGRVDDEGVKGRVREALGIAAAASQIRRARLGRIGRPIPGYLHVDAPDEDISAATGITLVAIDPDEVVDAWRAVDPARTLALDAEVRAAWLFEEDLAADESLERSLRAALALEDVVAAHGLDGGAFNCHVAQFRFGDEIGIAPCWGLGRLTSQGKPFTCTGDILTAVAMLVTKRLGGAALYHEIEAIDYATGEAVIANSGEHDLAWLAPGAIPRLRRNGWFCGTDPRCGVCAVLEPAPGPATLVGFTPHPDARGGFRLVAARGELTDRTFPATGTANGAFRFRDGSVEEAWARWARSGVNHHSSATPGDLSGAVVALAGQLGIEAVLV
jgi:L-arabinose isomerase